MDKRRMAEFEKAFEGMTLGGELHEPLNNLFEHVKLTLEDEKYRTEDSFEFGIPSQDLNIPKVLPAATPPIVTTGVRTGDVVASLIKQKKNKHIKQSSIGTYEKKPEPFAKPFPILPENVEPVIDYLDRFAGETGRHRRNNQDAIKMIYTHAVKSFGLRHNPMDKLERTMVTHKPIRTLSFKQGQILIKVPETLPEKAALELLYGHGWRQIELLRIKTSQGILQKELSKIARIQNLIFKEAKDERIHKKEE